MDSAARIPVPPSIDHFTILQTELAEQCKQVTEVMVQNKKLLLALLKGGGGGGGSGSGGKSGGGNHGGRHKTPWKEKNLPQLQQGGCPQSRRAFLP